MIRLHFRGEMTMTLTQLTEVFRVVFGDDTLVIDMDTTANDVDGWDSLSHVNLILAVESEFQVRFSQKELMLHKKVGDLVRDIEAKKG